MGKTIEKIERVAKMLNGRHMPKAYEVYKHFKGSLYVVITVARHTETNELFVIYSDIREMQRMYARPLEMFMSEVDHEKYPDAKYFYSTTKANKAHSDMEFEDGCFLVFGKETKGLPKPLIEANMETCMRIPMLKLEKARSLNLSNSVAIVVYEAMRQIGYPGMR